MPEKLQISVIIPAYNEEKAIKGVINNLLDFLPTQNIDFEILVINDGSTDLTSQHAKSFPQIRVIDQPYNKGYGAAIKTGLRNAIYDWVLLFDSDGQHQAQNIEKLLPFTNQFDIIIGARTLGYKGPILRQPGKKIVLMVANYISGHKIPDVNSGFRLVKKEFALKFCNLYPNGFSISTTMTLAFLKDGLNVKFVPYQVEPRIGKSTVKIRDGFKTLMLILKIIMLFSPLRVFLPLSLLIAAMAFISFVNDLTILHITNTTVVLTISSILLFSFGLLADQLADIRRELK